MNTRKARMPGLLQRTARLLLSLLVCLAGATGCTTFGRNTQDGTVVALQSPSGGDVPGLAVEQPDDSGRLTLRDLDPRHAEQTLKKLAGKGLSRPAAYQLYRQAAGQFDEASRARSSGQSGQSLFLKAAGTFKKAAARWPDSALEQDALFMAGESYFFADRYDDANDQYDLLLKKYPSTRHLDTVSLRKFVIARYWLDLDRVDPQAPLSLNLTDKTRPLRGTFSRAVKILDKLRLDDPTGRLADDATMAVGNAFFEKGKFIDASERYEDLIRTFPNSEHQFMAHLLALKCKLESYQGPQYDAGPLEKAEKLLKQIRKQFPRQADEHRQFLRRAYAEIRFRKAERELVTARYYERRHEYGAARFYYDIVAQQYGDTPLAEQATERLAKIEDKPAKPPQRLSWLVDLFPEPEEAKPLIPSGSPTTLLR